MPNCSVLICKNRTITKNLRTSGISYHRFPEILKYKIKWIEATGRDVMWFPSNQSVICSVHFEDECFNNSRKNRKLYEWATPTLRLRHVFEKSAPPSPKLISEDPSTSTAGNINSANLADPSRKLIFNAVIRKKDNVIKSQRMLIKRLQTTKMRYAKRIKTLKEIIKRLRDKRLIKEDQVSSSSKQLVPN